MIPKIIHCFWEGPKTTLAKRCIASWRERCPDWEIREWSLESLRPTLAAAGVVTTSVIFDEAIRMRRWAAVSDWVRMWALGEFGGVYLDCDVELLASLDDLMDSEWIASEWIGDGTTWMNPGGGIALEKGSALAVGMLAYYARLKRMPGRDIMRVINDGLCETMSALAVPPRILPPEVMSPIDAVGRVHRTAATHGIHWYAMSASGLPARICRWLAWHRLNGLVKLARRLKGAR